VGDAARLKDREAAAAAAFDEFEAQAALARPGVGHDAHRLPAPLETALERCLQGRQLGGASDELREPACSRALEMIAQEPEPLERVDAERLAGPLQCDLPEGAEREVTLDEVRGLRREVRAAGLGQLLHALCQTDGVPLGGVVHAQIVSDPADHHFTRIESHANGEVEGGGAAELVRVAPQLIAQVESKGCVTRFRLCSCLRGFAEGCPTLAAEFDPWSVREPAPRALELQRCAALAAEFYAARVLEAAGLATHLRPLGAANTDRPAPTGIQATGRHTSPSRPSGWSQEGSIRSIRRTVASEGDDDLRDSAARKARPRYSLLREGVVQRQQ
jgi:hypothetical protein